ncbi:MAG: alpha/beta hydrolase [Lachnospiraceae bacterium]|nr:alpha/beta hydrolase [Lachnospiraceae bacterium]
MALVEELSFKSADEVTTIHGYCWKPEGRPKAIVHICHGMVEYIERYNELAEFLCEKGYVVYGADTLGHGKSVVNKNCFGYFGEHNGNWKLLSDMVLLQGMAKRNYPGIPYYMIGHSFGSLMVREFVERFPDSVNGMVLLGTMYKNNLTALAGKLLCMGVATVKKEGYRYRSSLVNDIAVGGYDKRFEDENLRNSWLTSKREVVNEYNSIPECNFMFTVGAYRDMTTAMLESNSKKNLERIGKEMPILIMAGGQDPVGDFGKEPKRLYKKYKSLDLDCRIRIYKESRHELVNDVDKEQVFKDLLKWLDYYTK